jgi:hypothetical protein
MQVDIYCGNIYEIIDALMIGSTCLLGLIKLSMFRVYAKNLTRNYSSAVSDYRAIDTEEKRTIMRQHAFLGRMVFYFVVAFALITCIDLVITPLIGNAENVQVNVSINKYASKYAVPSVCTLGQLNVSTRMYLLLFVVQCIHIGISSCAYVGKLK